MKRIVIIIAIVLILLGLFTFSYFFLAINGGLGGWLKSLKHTPDWNNSSIVQARNKTAENINILHKDIQNKMNFNSHGAVSYDNCVRGQHNLEVNDSYAYECTYQITNFYSFNNDFRKTMLELDRILTSEGWQSSMSISKIINAYYDNPKNTSYGRTGLVSSLPRTQYYQDYQGNRTVYLNIEYAQKETAYLNQMEFLLNKMENINQTKYYNPLYRKIDSVNLHEIFRTASEKDKYFLTLFIEQSYFIN